MSELKTYTEEELAEHQQLYDEVFTPVWESEGQYCRAGGGQYEKSFAWWAFKHQQSKVDELQKQKSLQELEINQIAQANQQWQLKCVELQRRNQMLIDSIKDQGQKLVYQNEVIETQAEKLLGLRDDKAELQKRVDAYSRIGIGLIQDLREARSDPQSIKEVSDRQFFGYLDRLEQALKGGSTLNLNTDENGECRHFSTTMFHKGKAECFHCEAVVNENREVIGKQSKGLHPFFKKESK